MNATARYLVTDVLPVVGALLPTAMGSIPAWAHVLAIGLQESEFRQRRQIAAFVPKGGVVFGPARSWFGFEMGGVNDLFDHATTQPHLASLMSRYGLTSRKDVHLALEHNDVLAVACARLLLWIDPRPCPLATQTDEAWRIYLARWRPGQPRQATWADNFAAAWAGVA